MDDESMSSVTDRNGTKTKFDSSTDIPWELKKAYEVTIETIEAPYIRFRSCLHSIHDEGKLIYLIFEECAVKIKKDCPPIIHAVRR